MALFNGTEIDEVGSVTAIGTGNDATITHGLDIAKGDFIIATVHVNYLGSTITDDNGSYAFTEDLNGSGVETNVIAVFHRRAGNSEPSVYHWVLNISQNWSVILRVFRPVNGRLSWDVAPQAANKATGTGTTATAPSITTTVDYAVAVAQFFTDSATVTYSNPTNGFGYECQPAAKQAQASYLKEIVAAGAVGATEATLSTWNDWYCLQFAIKAMPLSQPHYTNPIRVDIQVKRGRMVDVVRVHNPVKRK